MLLSRLLVPRGNDDIVNNYLSWIEVIVVVMVHLLMLWLTIVHVFVDMCHGSEVSKTVIAWARVLFFSLGGEIAIEAKSIYGYNLALG